MKPTIYNLLQNIPKIENGNELFLNLLEYKNIKVEQICSNSVLNGSYYKQAHDEWILLLKGEAHLEIENLPYLLKKGDSLFIEKEQEHRVLTTDPDTIWLAIHIF